MIDHDLHPASSADVHTFMRLYRQLCPTVNDEVSIDEFARQLGWTIEKTHALALWLDERRLIETDRGLGDGITVIEGRSGT
jgi:hypothetical protein